MQWKNLHHQCACTGSGLVKNQVSLGVSKRTGALDVPSTPTFASRTKTAASSTTPVPDDNANNVNDESSGKHCLMGGGIEPPYNKGFMQRLNPIAEKGDDMHRRLGLANDRRLGLGECIATVHSIALKG